jgi:DNA-binding CsgD family transcriptional regulator
VSEQAGGGIPGSGDLRALVERSPVATLVFGRDQRVRIANEVMAKLIGSPEAAIVGLRPARVWDGAHARRCQMLLSALTAGALESYRAHRQLRTARGPVAVSVWVRRIPVIDGSVAVAIVVPETEPKSAIRSVGAFFGPDALDLAVGTLSSDGRLDRVTPNSRVVLGHDQSELAGIELASVVHPDDVDLMLSSVRKAAETSEGAFARVRLRHATRGWTETRCLFFPLPGDESGSMAFVLAETAELPPGPDAERIATLERHLLRFAAELHAGGWRDAQPLAVDASHMPALDELPRRQREIVDRLLRGERVPSIAASMYISPNTVRNHLTHVFTVFGVHSQSDLLALLRSGSDAFQRAEPDH